MNGMALCAGAGGLELGLRVALGDDYRCVVYVEREAYAAACLVARMADATLDTAPVWDDVSTFDGRPWRGVVDFVSAGFSCQPWSSAGKRLGIEDERWLWPDLYRVICEVGPEWVFLENVPGLVHGGLEHVLRDLATSRFAAEWDCVSAAEVGATQLRNRLYMLARRMGVGLANAQSGGFGVGAWSDGGTYRLADGCDSALAWTESQRPGETRRLRAGSPLRSDRSGEALADRDNQGCAGEWRQRTDHGHARGHADGRSRPSGPLGDSYECGRDGRASLAWRGSTNGTAAARTGEQLGSPNCSGLSPRTPERPGRFAADAGYWPPDRNYRGEWPSGFEPAVRRVVDGMAPWVDRLRLTGNGVVPLGAAVAFLRLRARLMETAD